MVRVIKVENLKINVIKCLGSHAASTGKRDLADVIGVLTDEFRESVSTEPSLRCGVKCSQSAVKTRTRI